MIDLLCPPPPSRQAEVTTNGTKRGRDAQQTAPHDRGSIRQLMARILVADNDAHALELAMLDLRLEGHTVLGAPDAQHLLDLLDGFAPDVVVLDHRMPPGPSGLAVAGQLRADRPQLRVVVYSNYQDIELVRQAAELGVPFLPKGNLRTLRAAVRG